MTSDDQSRAEAERLREVLRSTHGHEGEDHRDGPPGYDFDEQLVIERHEARRRLTELRAGLLDLDPLSPIEGSALRRPTE
jgi:hypothetical protein